MTEDNIATRHAAVARRFAEVIDGVEDWSAPSPVAEWNTRDVVTHLTEWLPGFLRGVGVDLPAVDDTDPAAAFAAQTRNVQSLLEAPEAGREVVVESMGAMPLDVLLDRFYVADVFMHTWDLARASGQPDRLDENLAGEMLVGMRPIGGKREEGGNNRREGRREERGKEKRGE